ncbi:MAG: hypothetical protein ACFFAU_20135 [Candidatus Hodarchaeota archaeon]
MKNHQNQIVNICQRQILDLWKDKLESGEFSFLTTGYYRGMWWDRKPGSIYYPVEYDHLYRPSYSINPAYDFYKLREKMHVWQFSKYVDDVLLILVDIILAIIGFIPGVDIIASVVLAFLLILLGIDINFLVNYYLTDESGCIWGFVKDARTNYLWFIPYSISFGLKLGSVYWLGTTYIFGILNPIIIPSFDIPLGYIKNW